jgi:hypothetical protein
LSDAYTRTVTPDQINTEALLQSRDYFGTASDFGATFSSDHAAAAQRARNVNQSTLSPQDTGESVQYNTDTIEPKPELHCVRATHVRRTRNVRVTHV